MAVKDEIALIFAGVGTQQEKIAAAGALRATRLAENTVLMERPYTRNGYRWEIVEFSALGNALIVRAEVRKSNATGPIVIGRDDPLNPMVIVNPITQVQTGTDVDGNPVFAENLTEAFRLMLDRHLQMRLSGNA